MKQKCVVCKIVALIAFVGALNWGLVGVLNKDLVASLLGEMTAAAKVVYILVGVCGLLSLASMFVTFPCCNKGCKPE